MNDNVIQMRTATEDVGNKVRRLYDSLPRRTEVLWADTPERAELLRILDTVPPHERERVCAASGDGARLYSLYLMERDLEDHG